VVIDVIRAFTTAAVNSSATAALAAQSPPVRLVRTGTSTSEDRGCAEHLATLLRGERPDVATTRNRILDADIEHRALQPLTDRGRRRTVVDSAGGAAPRLAGRLEATPRSCIG
jgi:phosphosulfolactate phosphohydrolase-like enzyme